MTLKRLLENGDYEALYEISCYLLLHIESCQKILDEFMTPESQTHSGEVVNKISDVLYTQTLIKRVKQLNGKI